LRESVLVTKEWVSLTYNRNAIIMTLEIRIYCIGGT